MMRSVGRAVGNNGQYFSGFRFPFLFLFRRMRRVRAWITLRPARGHLIARGKREVMEDGHWRCVLRRMIDPSLYRRDFLKDTGQTILHGIGLRAQRRWLRNRSRGLGSPTPNRENVGNICISLDGWWIIRNKHHTAEDSPLVQKGPQQGCQEWDPYLH